MNEISNEIPEIERIKQQHRALAVLRFLEREPSSTSNDQVFAARLENTGLVSARKQILGCLENLEVDGLTARRAVEKLVVVELTAKGEEVAKGRCEIEGALKPSVDYRY